MDTLKSDPSSIQSFISTASQQVFTLRDLWQQKQWSLLEEQAAHLKLSCESVGAMAVANACLDIRRAAAQAPEELRPLIENLFIEYSRTERELSRSLYLPKRG